MGGGGGVLAHPSGDAVYSGAIALIRSVLVTGAPGEGGISGWGAEDISFQRPSPEETRLTFDGSPQIQARQLITGTGGAHEWEQEGECISILSVFRMILW